MTMNDRLANLLRCPACSARYRSVADDRGVLVCPGCSRPVPIRDGIPRFVAIPTERTAQRTQASFGYEWTHFNDWRASGEINFNDYFQQLDLTTLGSSLVLDAGCGMGRHARQIAGVARHIVAVDFSAAIDQAARNTAECGNVDCLQADLLALPLADAAFDFVYSLGVLHHLEDTKGALAALVRTLRPGGRLRIYLYWKRHGWSGQLLRLVTWSRKASTRLPFPLLRALCFGLSLVLLVAIVIPFRLLTKLGVHAHESWPLFVYSKYPFRVLFNDQFDRFSAPIEKRYDADEVRDLLREIGLERIEVRSCVGWIADGVKPA